MPCISIVIVTHNSAGCIQSCLNAIFGQSYDDYEILIVDNGSGDHTKEIIRDNFPSVKIIENQENFGVCQARNQAIEQAGSDFILCLDHDVRLRQGFLFNIYSCIRNEEKSAAVQAKILRGDGKSIYSEGIRLSFLRRFHDIKSGSAFDAKDHAGYIFGACSAATIYRKEALEQVKFKGEYFDEEFFYFFEDADISWRLRKKGWEIIYCPQAVCLHEAGLSRRRSRYAQYLCFRNRYLTIAKNESGPGFIKFIFGFLIYDFWRNCAMLILNSRYFLKGAVEIIRLMPRVLSWRAFINRA